MLDSLMMEGRSVLLPLVEQIDPALVPELFCASSPRDLPLAIHATFRATLENTGPADWLLFWAGTIAMWRRPCLNPFESNWNTPTTWRCCARRRSFWPG